ncbi:MAG: MBL fold metallo-hydrolase [Lachnospiraceae bacterium]|nr:MBL fold metallo-hydrolase [Lachnospiraceae bacterium]
MGDIKVGRITLGMYMTNCYFVYKEGSSDVVVFDPADSGEYLVDKLSENGFNVGAIMLTHGHADHIMGVKAVKEKTGAPVYAYKAEEILLNSPNLNLSLQIFGRGVTLTPDVFLEDGEEIELCGIKIKTLFTPGHTEGSCCFYIEEAGFLIAGDTLFEESVGRTDYPTGSFKKLVESIKEKLLVLPDETKVYPGHGNTTTIGNEREYNPFLV